MRNSFDAALEDIEREDAHEHDDTRPPAFNPAAFTLPLPDAPDFAAAAQSFWETASAWTPEADPPPAPPPPPPEPPVEAAAVPSDEALDIAEELRLDVLRTPAEVTRARRSFMWENHPDRRKDLDRGLANRRVAIANMLLDRALAAIRQGWRGR